MKGPPANRRQRREAPPLSKQPFIFFCLVALFVHTLVLGGTFFLSKERSRPVIDAALVYGTSKLDMSQVHWVNAQPQDLVAGMLGRNSGDEEEPETTAPDPEPEPEPTPEPEPAAVAAIKVDPETMAPVESSPALNPDSAILNPQRETPEEEPPTVAAVPDVTEPDPERNMNRYGAAAPDPEAVPDPTLAPSRNPYGASSTTMPSSADAAILSGPPGAGRTDSPVEPDSGMPSIGPSPASVMRQYEVNLLETFEKGWRTPNLDFALQVRAEVIVGQDGRIIRSRIIQASNHFEMDQSVRRAMDQVIRAEPLPDFIDSPTYKFVLTFAIP